MLRTTLAGLRLHKGRLIATALAIVLSVMFVAGTLVFSDTMKDSFSSQVMGSADKLDAVVLPKAGGASSDMQGASPQLPKRALDEIGDQPEVASVGGIIRGDAPLLDKHGRAIGPTPPAGISESGATRHAASQGHLPTGADEVALATTTAASTGYAPGDEVKVVDPHGGKRTFRVSGLIDFGAEQPYAYTGAVAFTPRTAATMTGQQGYSEIDVHGSRGASPRKVADAVADAAGAGTQTMTGTQMGEKLAERSGAPLELVTVGLLMFAAVSVFVAGIVIYNTFAILVAQRQREMALLRCVGARRGQVFRGVLLEALIVALLSSAVGVLAGIGAGWAGVGLSTDALGMAATSTSVVVGPTAVLTGMLVGIAVTLTASLVPARRATRVAPLEALRTSAMAAALENGIGAKRAVAAVTILAISGVLVAFGARASTPTVGLVAVVAAMMAGVVGVVVVGPLLVKGVAAAIGRLMRHVSLSGTLAADNARRSPRRAATAMIALTVGAMLISGYSALSTSIRTTLDDTLAKQFPADYVLSPPPTGTGDDGVPRAVTAKLADAAAVGDIYSQRQARTSVESSATTASTFLGAKLGTDIQTDITSGSLADVRPGAVAVAQSDANGRTAGDTVRIRTEGGERTYTIAAVTSDSGTVATSMAPSDFASAFPSVHDNRRVLVNGADGASDSGVRAAVEVALAGHPTLRVESMTEMKQQVDDVMDIAYASVVTMLGLAVLIAVFGIANTMALSVLERTRESAILRAMGLTGGQLRRMLSLEAILVCLTGAAVGIGLGMLFAWAGGSAALGGVRLTIPAGQIALFIAVAVVAGALAAALPARRAARTSIADALASE